MADNINPSESGTPPTATPRRLSKAAMLIVVVAAAFAAWIIITNALG